MKPVELPVCETNGWSMFRQLAALATAKKLDKADVRAKLNIVISIDSAATARCHELHVENAKHLEPAGLIC